MGQFFTIFPLIVFIFCVTLLLYYLCAANFAGVMGLASFVSGKRTVLGQQASRR
jgi:hypothetical protein